MCEYYLSDILRLGHVPLDRVKKMHNIDRFCDPAGDFSEFFQDLRHISESEKALLQGDQAYFLRVFGFMNQANQDLVLKAVS